MAYGICQNLHQVPVKFIEKIKEIIKDRVLYQMWRVHFLTDKRNPKRSFYVTMYRKVEEI